MTAPTDATDSVGSLLVFADDWGRHPSSCQHLVRQLLDQYPVTWVNTIGTRTPSVDLATLRRASEKLVQWCSSRRKAVDGEACESLNPAGLQVLSPKMWPWFSHATDRRLNRWLLQRQLTPVIQKMPQPVVALTTLPITADLPDVLPVDRWVYYCVDDFSVWPGLDGKTLRAMDQRMIARADALIAVSEHLRNMIAEEGRTASLLTHGIDLDFWQSPDASVPPFELTSLLQRLPRPLVVFWGVIDRRMSTRSILQLSNDLRNGTILLIGPQQDPDPQLLAPSNVVTLSPQPIHHLPWIAAQSGALIMPYADLPVTRAMQPLKLKEYLATGKPVVVNQLPAIAPWNDCLDSAECPEQFSQFVLDRLANGLPEYQRVGRKRLKLESWPGKANSLDWVLRGNNIEDPANRPQKAGKPFHPLRVHQQESQSVTKPCESI